MKPDLTEAEHRLLTAYTQAALQLSRELNSFTDPKDVARILQRIDAILAQLDQLTAEYLREGLPEQFKIGSAVALYELRKLRLSDLDSDFTGIHTEAVRELARDAAVRFGEGIEAVRRDATVTLSRASKEAVLQGMMQKELTGADATKAVKGVFADAIAASGEALEPTVLAVAGQGRHVITLYGSISNQATIAGHLAIRTTINGRILNQTVLTGTLANRSCVRGAMSDTTGIIGGV